jgi:hypothetical protein
VFAIFPYVAELLAVVTLSEATLGSICLHPDRNVAEVWETENFLGFCRLGLGDEEKRQIGNFGIFGG